MSLLDGDLQLMFGAAFSGVLLEGRHYKRTESRNQAGDVTAVVNKVQSFKGYREQDSARMVATLGLPPNTAVILILQSYEGRPITEPARMEQVKLDGQTWTLGDLIEEDAGHVAWRFAATPA